MGIPGLWDLIGRGELVPIAQLAADCWEQHGRPYRIAVDEAGWRFNNLNEQQVEQIQAGEPAANPIEKGIFYRATRLLRLNIELIFVFDGPSRPWKRGKRGGGKIDYAETKLLKELLKQLGIPYHHAPSEAEAECARMQELGVVDAVWSDDGDSLMFGATTLIRAHYEKGKGSGGKSTTYVRVMRMDDIRRKPGLQDMDRYGIALLALLSGGDYDMVGIPGCGPQKALGAFKQGLGRAFRDPSFMDRRNLESWTVQVKRYLATKGLTAPPDWPKERILKHYLHPAVFDTAGLLKLSVRWIQPKIDEEALRSLLCLRFNIQTKAYIKHVVPIWVTRAFRASNMESCRTQWESAKIHMVKPRAKQTTEPEEKTCITKIKYNPQTFTKRDLSVCPMREGAECWQSTDDFRKQTTCEVPEILLKKAMPHLFEVSSQVPEARKTASTKRKSSSQNDEGSSTKKQKTAKKQSIAQTGSVMAGDKEHSLETDARSLWGFIPPPPLIVIDDDDEDQENHVPLIITRTNVGHKARGSSLPSGWIQKRKEYRPSRPSESVVIDLTLD